MSILKMRNMCHKMAAGVKNKTQLIQSKSIGILQIGHV